MAFTELGALSNFTFLIGASHPEEYMLRAAELGMDGLAVADVNSVAGIVRAHTKAREMARDGGPKLRLIPAARLVMRDGFTVTALPQHRAGWGNLCRLLTLGRRRAEKGTCDLGLPDLLEWGAGLAFLLHPLQDRHKSADSGWVGQAERLVRQFPGQCHLLLAPRYDGQDLARFAREERLAKRLGVATVASAQPIMHHGSLR
jgi:DNA polymerase III alpha subunit